MSSDFTVGALALADPRANAVGAVRLTLLPDLLRIELVRAAGFSEGFVPGSMAQGGRFEVPYSAVRGLVRSGRLLLLTLDPAVSSPYTRFALARFTDDPAEALGQIQKARTAGRWAALVLPWPLGLLSAELAPVSWVGGALGRVSLGIVAAALFWLLARESLSLVTWGGPASDRLRDDFELKLSRKLGMAAAEPAAPYFLARPRRVRLPAAPDVELMEIPDLLPPRAPVRRILPPPTIVVEAPPPMIVVEAPPPAIVVEAPPPAPPPAPPIVEAERPAPLPAPLPIALEAPALPRVAEPPPPPAPRRTPRFVRPAALLLAASLGAVGTMLFLGRYGAPKTPPPPVPAAVRGLASAVSRARVVAEEPPDPANEHRPRCVCMRSDSPLWKDPLPALRILTYTSDEQLATSLEPAPDRRGRPQYVFDLAVVNDSARPLSDIRVTLTFARRSKEGKRIGATDRGLFWAGALQPGHAVKWHVKAPGSEVTMDASVNDVIDEDRVKTAPPDAFVELASSKARVLRAHAAMMLAYLGDARARDIALSLGGSSEADRALAGELARVSAPLRVCSVTREGDHLSACVFNASMSPRPNVVLKPSPAGSEPAEYPLGGVVPVHEGIRVELPLAGDEAPAAWEAAGADAP
ncbi:MAG: hypothetical protein U0359_31050 [Byssovorax sp.]